MNYVELHIGDYEKATAHLTACEDGIYGRMIRRYYDTEAPLPLDLKAIQRFVRARSRDEKEAVETLLEEFFIQADDGWHHKRCDEEIARYNEKREKAQRSANARWNACERNANASRSSANGVRGNASSQEKKSSDAMRQGNNGTNGNDENSESNQHSDHANASADAMRTHSEGNAHQSPYPSHQSSIGSTEIPPNRTEGVATDAGAICAELRSKGCVRVNPQHPDLLTALARGITRPEILAVAEEGIAKGKQNPFTWALTTALNRHSRGEPIIPEQDHADLQRGGKLSAADRVRANAEAGEQRDRDADNDRAVVRVIG